MMPSLLKWYDLHVREFIFPYHKHKGDIHTVYKERIEMASCVWIKFKSYAFSFCYRNFTIRKNCAVWS